MQTEKEVRGWADSRALREKAAVLDPHRGAPSQSLTSFSAHPLQRVIFLAVYAGPEPSYGLAHPRHRWRGKHLYDFAASTRSLLNMRYDKTSSGWGRGVGL